MEALYGSAASLPELPEQPGSDEDREQFGAGLNTLDAYFRGGVRGTEEDREVALDLARQLELRSKAYGQPARALEWLVLKQAELLIEGGKPKEALERLESLEPTDPEWRFEFALLAAQHDGDELRREEFLLRARETLTSIQEEALRLEFECQWCSVAVYQAVKRGLPDRANEPWARGMELARGVLKSKGERRWLDEMLLAKIALHTTLIEHERVVELLRRPNPDLPAEDSLAALRMTVREGHSRAYLEPLGKTPPDQARRDPIELLERALADARLPREDRQLALATLTQVWLDRGDLSRASQALERLQEFQPDARLTDDRIALASELALRRGAREEFARLRETSLDEWRAFLARRKEHAAHRSELGLLHSDEVARLFRGLAKLEVALEGPERGAEKALLELIEAQAIGPLAQALGAAPPTLAEVRALLTEGELALLHLPAREEGLIFVLTRERVELLPLAKLPDIVWTRADFSRALERALLVEDGAEWKEVERLAEALARIALPGELRARVARATRLTIVAPENLGYVPFEFLPGPDGRPLGRALEVRYLPSLPVGAALAARRAARPGSPAGADATEIELLWAEAPAPIGTTTFEPLPAGPKELAQLLSPYAEARRRLCVGPSADRKGMAELLANPARVLQIVSHGYLDRRLERPAQLVLSGANGLVSAEEFERLAYPPLVVLGACGTWDGPRRRGDDGRAHLPSAFLLGGADTVIAAQRPLLFRPALSFFGAFHRSLHAGAPPVRALREARARIVEESSSRRERALACLIHAIGLADAPIF